MSTIDRTRQPEYNVSFFDVFAWESTADLCWQFLKKGQLARVIGLLKEDRWAGPDGQPRSKVCIVAHQVDFSDASRTSPSVTRTLPLLRITD